MYLDCFLFDTDLETLRIEKNLNGSNFPISFFLVQSRYSGTYKTVFKLYVKKSCLGPLTSNYNLKNLKNFLIF